MTDTKDEDTLRVASATPVPDLAGAITAALTAKGFVFLRAVGAGAVNQAVKASAVAGGYLGQAANKTLSITPTFVNVQMPDGATLSGVLLKVTAN